MIAIELRPLNANDAAAIENWPVYRRPFEDLDYAMRRQGWLAELPEQAGTWRYAAEQSGEVIAFTILSATAEGEAEFRIALRPDKTGQGLGESIAARTLALGFRGIGLARIHLVVRQNHRRAIRLYQCLGFVQRGECRKTVNGQSTHFFLMDLARDDYLRHLASPPATGQPSGASVR